MAVSPVVTQTADRAKPVASPLKIVGASTQTSANGTPLPAPSADTIANLPPTLDLAEQMNDEEKRKYVKGTILHSFSGFYHLDLTIVFQARSSVRVPTPSSSSVTFDAIPRNSSPSRRSKYRKSTQRACPLMPSEN